MKSSIYSQLLISAGRNTDKASPPPKESMAEYREGLGRNPLCGDQVRWFVRLDKEEAASETRIADIRYEASGCLMCKASASFLARFLPGKTMEEAGELYDEVTRITEKSSDEGEPAEEEITEETQWRALAQIRDYPARRRCVMMPWDSFFQTLDGEQTSG
jgi:nitrogen fixation NifU-like protein